MRRSPGSAGGCDGREPSSRESPPSPAALGKGIAPSFDGRRRGRLVLTAIAVEAAAPRAAPATRAFSAFEWMVAFRYLRARNAQRSISVIAGFSFLGIVLGVAALIVVMSVMNGFRHDRSEEMIGLNGHMFLQGV